jgi:hypothetical protein
MYKREEDYQREFTRLLELAGWGAGVGIAILISAGIILRLV